MLNLKEPASLKMVRCRVPIYLGTGLWYISAWTTTGVYWFSKESRYSFLT